MFHRKLLSLQEAIPKLCHGSRYAYQKKRAAGQSHIGQLGYAQVDGGFLQWGIPNSWMVDFMDIPSING